MTPWLRSRLKKVITLSVVLSVITFALGLGYYYVSTGQWLIHAAFDGVYLVSAVIVCSGLAGYFLPINQLVNQGDKLLDHSTYGMKAIEKREQGKAYGNYLTWVGLLMVVVAGVGQLLVLTFG